MGNFYVTKAGANAAERDGGITEPWLTIDYAYSRVANDGTANTWWIGDGTYAEDSGGGYWNLHVEWTAKQTIRSSSGDRTAVIITGAASAFGCLATTHNGNLGFKDLTFAQSAEPTSQMWRLDSDKRNNNYSFENVAFTITTENQNTKVFYALSMIAGGELQNWTLTDCHFGIPTTSVGSNNPWDVTRGHADAVMTNIKFINCTLNSASKGIGILGTTDVVVEGGTYACTGSVPLYMGVDGTTGDNVTGRVTGATISSDTSHAFLVGAGATDVEVSQNDITGGDYGLVIKQCNDAGVKVHDNIIKDGSLGSLYCKGATLAQIYNNTIHERISGANALTVGKDAANNDACGDLVVKNNIIIAEGTADIFEWGVAADDSGGSVCDNNVYEVRGSGNIGSVYGTAGITTLAALQGAWSTYDVTTNDTNSGVGTTVDAQYVPISGGLCDVGRGDSSVRPTVGNLDALGRPKLRAYADCVGGVYPQRDAPENILKPLVQYAGEIATRN